MKIVLATANRGKLGEIRAIIDDPNIELLTFDDFPDRPVLTESGDTFYENAVEKAKATADFYGLPALADDSGLEVDALDGAPGVYSARYSGKSGDDSTNNEKLLTEMADVPHGRRGARFRAVAACVFPDGRVITTEGVMSGEIITEPRGRGGFGYDPLFIVKGRVVTNAELTPAEKNAFSHRGQAFRKMKDELERVADAAG